MGYSSIVSDHFLNPRNAGEMDHPDAEGRAGTPDAGPFVVIQLRIRDDRVEAARFRTFGCGPAIAACSMLTEWAAGRTVADANAISGEELVEMLGGLPEDKRFCAEMAVQALKQALAQLQPRPERPCG
jgi:NifU-like protein involved in Fe-S cluster formation